MPRSVHLPAGARPAGYQALIERLGLKVLPHHRSSYTAPVASKTAKGSIHVYPQRYGAKDACGELEFALKYDGVNLEILAATFDQIDPEELENFIKEKPSSTYRRPLWFLFEWLTGKRLNLADSTTSTYVDLLDPDLYYTAMPVRSRRHRVRNNLMGTPQFCPLVRRTERLTQFEKKHLHKQACNLLRGYDYQVLKRATRYLYKKETLSSYQIEREHPDSEKSAQFENLLQSAQEPQPMTGEKLVRLQNVTVAPSDKDTDYRTYQNYVGQHLGGHRQVIHYVSPKPNDVPGLMDGLLSSLEKVVASDIHPVVAAASISFGFVYVHPFGDGNGRLHRFLIHYVLAQMGYTPDGMIFPVSAVMLRNEQAYDETLEQFSKPLMNLVHRYKLDERGEMRVDEETVQYYRYIDYTPMAEFLFHCIERTVERDFKEELDYLVHYDQAKRALQGIVDMPDRLIDLFIRLCMQNEGKLSARKQERHFSMLSDREVEEMQAVVDEILRS